MLQAAEESGAQASLPRVAYEREPGAACRPLPSGYRRREPEASVLYQIVLEHLASTLEQARERSDTGAGYPAFVDNEFLKYLGCGQLCRGFARIRCPDCGFERLVPYSCKGRLCPSCQARRAADTAAHLVDRLLPEAAYRQYVLTFPREVHFLLSVDPPFMTRMLGAYLQFLFAWQRRRGEGLGIEGGHTAAVTFVQRFSSSLSLFPHLHSLVPDGLFVPCADGEAVRFVPLPPPTDDDIAQLTSEVAERLTPIAVERLRQAQQQTEWVEDEDVALYASTAEALRSPLWLVDPRQRRGTTAVAVSKPLCSRVGGFSLHAARLVEAHDRRGLERLCRYGLRAPLALDRLSLDPDGKVRYQLPKPGPRGQTEVVLEPLAFMRRLAALIPRPYANSVRYHGVFANRSRYRPLLPRPPTPPTPAASPGIAEPLRVTEPAAPPPQASASEPPQQSASPEAPDPIDDEPLPIRPRRLSWAQLLARVLDVRALTCPRCGAAMVVLAFITDPPVVKRILEHLGLPTSLPRLSPARSPLAEQRELDLIDEAPPDDELLDLARARSQQQPGASRAPPRPPIRWADEFEAS
jgi:hypothetical protein